MKNARYHERRVVLEDISSDETMISSLALCEKEEKIIPSNFVNDQDDHDEEARTVQGFEDEMQLYQAMKLRTEHGQFAMNIGATNILDQVSLDDDDNDDSQASNETDENSMDDPEAESELMDWEDNDLDILMASTAQVGKSRGVNPKHLSKIWRISQEDAKNTIDVTTQASIQKDNPVLSRNYSTNNRMLRYKRIKDFFFLDAYFATKKGGQSSRGHTCCQLFVTDKGFIYVVTMKSKSEVLLAIKQFTKEVGTLILLWQICLVNKCHLK